MITLEVKDYCQNCRKFSAETQSIERNYFTCMDSLVDTVIKCSHAEECEEKCRYLQEQKRKG